MELVLLVPWRLERAKVLRLLRTVVLPPAHTLVGRTETVSTRA